MWPTIELTGYITKPVPLAARWEARTVFDRPKTGIAGSNTAWRMDVCPRFSVMCSPVWVEALRRADPSSEESYQMLKF